MNINLFSKLSEEEQKQVTYALMELLKDIIHYNGCLSNDIIDFIRLVIELDLIDFKEIFKD